MESVAAPVAPAAKIKYTSKIKRGLALIRMLVIAGFREDMLTSATIVKRWTKKQEAELNDALKWIEQEEDWESVADAWKAAGGE